MARIRKSRTVRHLIVRVRHALALAIATCLVALAALAVALVALFSPAQQVTIIRHTHTTVIQPVQAGPYKHVAAGGASLDAVASARHTTVAGIQRATLGSPLLSVPARAAFTAYLHGGTASKMPAGLVYYTVTGPARG